MSFVDDDAAGHAPLNSATLIWTTFIVALSLSAARIRLSEREAMPQ